MNDDTEAEQGIWRLISPSGREYQATSPLRCCRAEINDRLSAKECHKCGMLFSVNFKRCLCGAKQTTKQVAEYRGE